MLFGPNSERMLHAVASALHGLYRVMCAPLLAGRGRILDSDSESDEEEVAVPVSASIPVRERACDSLSLSS